jgi:hypothetical protein
VARLVGAALDEAADEAARRLAAALGTAPR